MTAEILDKKEQENKVCYLTKVSLKDYILGLPTEYKSYYIQREIVQNPYLDNLINTILTNGHIPSIVLVIEKVIIDNSKSELQIEKFQILDGLQRTHRLKVIWDTIQLLNNELENSKEILNYTRIKISREFSKQLNKIESSSTILSKLIDYKREFPNENIEDKFNDNSIWFEVWSGLSPDEQVQKMLILNAGHKPVKAKHQLELLFNNLIPIITKTTTPTFKLIKEKEVSSIQHSKNRAQGHFHFSHIISAVLSYEAGKPITTNINLIQKAQNREFYDEDFDIKYDFNFFETFIRIIVKLDLALYNSYKELGTQWLGREIVLVGLFASLGKIAKDGKDNFEQVCTILDKTIIQYPKRLNLLDFEKVRNGLDLSKINIGSVNKIAVYNGLYDLMNNDLQDIQWKQYFKVELDEN